MYIRLLLFACVLLCKASLAQTAKRFDIVIDELFPDPTPVIGLPNSEFIELKNVSAIPFNLLGWKLSDGSSTATINTDFILQPDSFVIICSNAAVPLYSSFGHSIGVSNFPSLNNDADIITLLSPEGGIIHTVAYTNNWYQNAVKADGGWTLEMIDTRNPCAGMDNWKASVHNKGGTPGLLNSVHAINKDELLPALTRTYSLDSLTLVAVFDEPLDSSTMATAANYTLDNGIGQAAVAMPILPLYNEVVLKFSTPLSASTIYQLSVTNITDCSGNSIGSINTAKAGIPVPAENTDVVINEILFNPAGGGYDYIELYNSSNKIINLAELFIANRNSTGNLTNSKRLSAIACYFFPGEHLVFTENSQWLKQNYVVKNTSAIIELASLPSMPDDIGNLVLLNQQESIVDDLAYDKKWHFALIDNDEGVALERINYKVATQEKSNWTSAASTAGYGTPGYQNSQFRADLQVQGSVSVQPQLFSPDNNGLDDFTTIQLQMTEPGYMATITVFDVAGRTVRYLAKNALPGLTGNFRWDGLGEQQQKLPIGMYIIVTEIFNLQGKTKKFKNVVTLARTF